MPDHRDAEIDHSLRQLDRSAAHITKHNSRGQGALLRKWLWRLRTDIAAQRDEREITSYG